MRLLIVGAGGTGRELLRRLSDLWEVAVIDIDPTRLDGAQSIREFEPIAGDGSSAVVLKRAGLDTAAALIAATSDDDANLEAVRLAKGAGLLRVVGVAADPDRLDDYAAMDLPVFAPNRLAARQVELALEPRRVASSAFAGGKAEAIEVELARDAAVVGRRLSDLHSQTWVVATVLRGDDVIVAHGDTVLQAGDRVTVVGAAADYAAIVASFTTGISTFPLAFGRKVAVGVDTLAEIPGHFVEAVAMVRNSQAELLIVVHPVSDPGGDEEDREDGPLRDAYAAVGEGIDIEFRESAGSVRDGLLALMDEESVGVVVVAGPDPARRFSRFHVAKAINMYSHARRVPLLLARSPGPYDGVFVPARRTVAGESAARAAIDLARSSGLLLSGIAAVAPSFVATRVDTLEAAKAAMGWLREEAAVHGVDVSRRVQEGNPVRVIAGLVSATSLLVMGAPLHPVRGLTLGISGLVAARVPSSVLLVPGHE